MRSCVLLSALVALVQGKDPSPGWLSYAVWTAPNEGKVTGVNTTWTVPNKPKNMFGSNAPGWWFGIQTTKGDGALIQPILAWDYRGEEYSIFNACFDWTDGSWHTSDEVYRVSPGDKISSSIKYREADNSYDMYIEGGGKSITTNYKLEKRQHAAETTVYFVLEHAPSNCKAYPESGICTFENIQVEVDGKVVAEPAWEAKQETPKCNSKAAVVDSKTIKFTWDATGCKDQSTEPLDQCKKDSYAFCCEVGKPCDCTKGVTAPGQCKEASYLFCCSVGVPCDCTQPPAPESQCDTKATALVAKPSKVTSARKLQDQLTEPLDQCKKDSYAFCCEVGKPCDCTKGVTAPGQCKEASYLFCCSVGVPCDCTQPPSTNLLPKPLPSNNLRPVPVAKRTVKQSLATLMSRIKSCPAHTTECDYASGKSACCTKGEYCIKGVGCTCEDGNCLAGPTKWSAHQ